MSKGDVVCSSEDGDLRKKGNQSSADGVVDEAKLLIEIRRLTSGKGRTIIELKGLPNNKSWCKKLAKNLKSKLAVGGAYKNDFIEVHGEKLEEVKRFLDTEGLKFKQIGG